MAELATILENNIFHRKVHIHDVVDAGATLGLSSGVEVIYPCDPSGGFEYKSNGDLWNPVTGIFNDPEGIIDAVLLVKWNFVINVGLAKEIDFRIFIPDVGGDIEVYAKTYPVVSGDNVLSNTTSFYMGAEALASGFKVTLTPNNAMDIKSRSILITG